MLLTIPAIRQGQPHECGKAVLQAVLAFHGIVAPVNVSTPTDGTDPREIESFLRRLRMPVISGTMEIEDLRHFANTRRPPIVLIHPPDYADSHYVVVRGVGRGAVYTYDPDGCQNQRFGFPDWAVAWHATGRFEPFRRWAIVSWLP